MPASPVRHRAHHLNGARDPNLNYARRKAIVKPVFGQIHTRQGKHLLLRGLEQAGQEWNLIVGCHNLLKLFTMQGNAGLAVPAGT